MRRPAVATAVCFVVPLALYASTAARTIQGGDTGEFANIAFLGGVAHPPGYPLYSLLMRLAALVPLGALFFRVAMVSALCGAAAVAVLQRATFRLTDDVWASVIAALVFAVSREQWLVAGVPEVFSLNALLAALVADLSLGRVSPGCREMGPSGWGVRSFALGLVGGLGLSNHLSIIWCVPLVLWAIWSAPHRTRAAGAIVAGGTIGLLPYAALPWMAHSASAHGFVWGQVDTWRGFLDHLLRREYGMFRLGREDAAGFRLAPVLTYLSAVPRDMLYLPAVAALAGVVIAIRRRIGWAIACALSFVLAGGVFIALFNGQLDAIGRGIQERFYVLPDLLLAPLATLGLSEAFRWRPAILRTGAVALITLGVFITYPDVKWHNDTFIERYYRALVADAPPDSVLIGEGDTEFSAVRWVTQVLRVRPDVHFVERSFLNRPWYVAQLKRELPDIDAGNLTDVALRLSAKHPVYSDWSCEPFFDARVQQVQEGLLRRIAPAGTPDTAPAKQEELLLKAAQVIGDQPLEPIEQQNALVRLAAGEAWRKLGAGYAASGDSASAERCLAHAVLWIPTTGLGEEWYRQHAHAQK